ncbi:MAG: ATP-binding protein [Thermoflexales bacterium]
MPLSEFLAANRDLILFIYGQVFFIMGVAIAFQSRRYSRLDLARSLTWLAFFGLIHGLHEWGDIFIPIQSRFVGEPLTRLMQVAHLFMLGASFACLLEFGVSLLRTFLSPGTAARLRWVPLGILGIWFGGSVYLILPFAADYPGWQRIANASARYMIGLPGALLAAYGLRRHAVERIARLKVPAIVNALRVSGIALMFYGFFGGFIGPAVDFPPGNVLNTSTFQDFVGLPVTVFRSLAGAVLAFSIIRALEVFELETQRMVEGMEQKQILSTERERIGRDLHDGAIQLVYTAGLLVESAKVLATPQTAVANRLEKAETVLNDAVTALRRNLGELRPAPSAATLFAALQTMANDPRFASFVDVKLVYGLSADDKFAPERADHIITIVTEALSNVVRHAGARHVTIGVTREVERLRVTVQDDGAGLPRELSAGYGLRNMRDRARLLGGALDVGDAGRRGTQVTLDVPWRDER